MSQEPQRSHLSISWASLLLLGPPGIYFIAFVHEYAYANAFGYPSSLISIQVATLVQSLLAVVGVGALVFAFYSSLYLYGRLTPRTSEIPRALIAVGFFPLIFLMIFLYFRQPLEWIVWAVFLLIYPCLTLIPPIFWPRNVKGYRQRLAANDAAADAIPGFWRHVASRTGWMPILLGASVIVATFLSYSVGRADALNATSYFVTDFQGSQMFVLRIYGNEVIMTPKSHPSGRLTGKFAVAFISDSHPFAAQQESVGPLLTNCTWGVGCH